MDGAIGNDAHELKAWDIQPFLENFKLQKYQIMKKLLVTILAMIAVILIVSESESICTLLLTKVIGFAVAYAAYELFNLKVSEK